MGLVDILNGMQNGPRGQRQPGGGGSGGGMSPLTMALLGLLAYKAVKSFSGASPTTTQAAQPPEGNPENAGNTGGGLGGMLRRLVGGGASGGAGSGAAGSGPATSLSGLIPGELGNLLGGAAAGTMVSSGIGNLIKGFQDSGHGRAAQSWVGTGPNEEIAPNDLEHAVGADTLDALARQTGMNRDDLLSGLSQQLPELINQLTPNGRLPTDQEASRMV